MPFKSKAQRRYFYAAESRGDLPEGTAAEWEAATGKKKLPEKVSFKKTAAELQANAYTQTLADIYGVVVYKDLQ